MLIKLKMNSNLNKLNMNLRKVLDECHSKGGVTYNIYSGEYNPRSGYMVSLFGRESPIYGYNHNEAQLANFVHANIDKLADSKYYLGLWTNNEGIIIADVNTIVDQLVEACELGIKNNQVAIYDNKYCNVINLPTPQRTGTMTQRNTYAAVAARTTAEKYLASLKS